MNPLPVAAILLAGCWTGSAPAPAEPAFVPVVVRTAPKSPCEASIYDDSDAMRRFCRHVERVCTCKDVDCITAHTETYGKEMAEWARDNAAKAAQPPSEEMKRVTEELVKELVECTTQIAKATAAPAP
ncbi:MAG: hypothetical protein KF773_18650 [Deltaproteobacteria bacterium]|nr:hypothetical protein [Deltaproteobacteria bacterium]